MYALVTGAAARQSSSNHLHRTGSPSSNAWIESFNGRLRDVLFNAWQVDSLVEAQGDPRAWRVDYKSTDPTATTPSPPKPGLRVEQRSGCIAAVPGFGEAPVPDDRT
jgi:hypothetical protein